MKASTHNRADILTDAITKITGSRQEEYGDPHVSHELIAALWTNYLSVHPQGPLMPHDVAVMCVLQKVARIALNPTHADNYVDIGGYAGIAGELAPLPAQPDLPMKSTGETVGSGQVENFCSPAKTITPAQAVVMTEIASRLHSSAAQFSELENGLITRAMLNPASINTSEYELLLSLFKQS